MSEYKTQIDSFMEELIIKNGNEPEFIQAVEEVAETVIPFIEKNIQAILSCNHIILVILSSYYDPPNLILYF